MATLAIVVDNETDDRTHLLSLQVTVEQEVAIYAFFQFNNWKITRKVIPEKCVVCNTKISQTDEVDQSQLGSLFDGQLAVNNGTQTESPVVIQIIDQQSSARTVNIPNSIHSNTDDFSQSLTQVTEEDGVHNVAEGFTNLEQNIGDANYSAGGDSVGQLNESDLQNIKLPVSTCDAKTLEEDLADVGNNNSFVNCDNEEDDDSLVDKDECQQMNANENSLTPEENRNTNLTSGISEMTSGKGSITVDAEQNTEINLFIENLGENIHKSKKISEVVTPSRSSKRKLKENEKQLSPKNKKESDSLGATLTPTRQSSRLRKEKVMAEAVIKDIYPFNCSKCGKGYMEERHLNQHVKTYHSDKSRMCDECGKSFRNLSLLREHKHIHDVNVKQFACDQCKKVFTDATKLELHKKCHLGLKPYTCEICGRGFRQIGHLNCHRDTHKDNKSRKFKCDFCDLTFADVTSRLRHYRTHTGAKPYPCKECGKSFRQFSHLQEHMRIHTGERPHKCTYCDKTFTDHTSLRKHTDMHLGVKYKCEYCDKQFTQTCSLRRHVNTHTQDKKYECDKCGKVFLYLIALQKHQEKHEIGWKCKICNKTFHSKEDHNQHRKTHAKPKPHECRICLLVFKSKTELAQHLKEHRNIENSDSTTIKVLENIENSDSTTVVHTITLPYYYVSQ